MMGCQPGARRGGEIICPGKASIHEAVNVLTLQRQNLLPFQANAECVVTYRDEDGDEKQEPVRGAKMAFVPDEKVYFKGELVFKELRFGTNEAEFWLRIKADLEDFGDSFWWGARADIKQCPETLPVNPDNIAEALGIVDVTPDWELSNRDGYDILTLIEDGRIRKRISVNACDYRIEEIDYFDAEGLKRVSVRLQAYSAEENGIMVPTWIQIVSYDRMGLSELAVLFELKNIRSLPPERIGKKLFARPRRDGYEHLYRLNENCEFVED
ncbi:MAG: hypothetical protein ACYSOZ_03655 [Planctomycetota bacterium]